MSARIETRTLAEWSEILPLLMGRLDPDAATPVAPDVAAALADVAADIMRWQENFRVDGDAAAGELCPITVPDAFPVVGMWTRDA